MSRPEARPPQTVGAATIEAAAVPSGDPTSPGADQQRAAVVLGQGRPAHEIAIEWAGTQMVARRADVWADWAPPS